MRASNVEEMSNPGTGDPWEVFTQLVIQIIEGRTPGGEKGFHAGPHCALPQYAGINRHVCEPSSPLCSRYESLLRQLRLMWGVGVGVSVEVLVAPECEHGAAFTTALDTTTSAPSPQLRLLEQWNFAIFDRTMPDAMISGWSLVAAVRSFLHFSQLSAWLSASRGARPPNVLYRLAVTSPVFCSKFEADSEEHTFPVANVGQETAIKVVVRSLPRINHVPVVSCCEIHPKEETLSSSSSSSTSTSSSTSYISLSSNSLSPTSSLQFSTPSSSFSYAAAVAEPSFASSDVSPPGSQNATKCEGNGKAEEDLRRSMMRARLGDPSRNSRSESPDTQLGESLLDPPNSLSRIPRRFQSPSRSGSPSMETPEHIICRVRQPGPSHGRPPDMPSFCQPLVIPARQPLNTFAWTQTRYPTTQHQYRHHQHVSSDIFHPPNILTEPVQVEDQHDNPLNHQYCSERGPIPYMQISAPRQSLYGSDSQHEIFWSHQTDNIPRSVYEKSSSSFAYQVLHPVPSSHCKEGQSIGQHQQAPFEILEKDLEQRDQYQQATCYAETFDKDSVKYCHQNENYFIEYNKPFLKVVPQAGTSVSCHEEAVANEPIAGSSSSCLGVDIQCSKDPSTSDLVSPGRESQGTKRKGAYNKDSPRTKRESPPHIYYAKEGKGSEYLKLEAKDDERVKRKNSDEDGNRRKSCSSKRAIDCDQSWSKRSDDQMWQSCSQPGKHLCSSVEDISEISSKDDQVEFMPNAKSLRKDKRTYCKMDASCSAKVSFELTPKETQEVLNVLRQNNPVPPLRIDQHKCSTANNQLIETRLKMKPEGKFEQKDKDKDKCLRIMEKLEDTGKSKCKASEEVLPYQKGESSSMIGCHRQNASKTMQGLKKEDEIYAYPTSSNKSCDTRFKKSIKCTCDTNLNDKDILGSELDDSDDDDVLDGWSPAENNNSNKQSKRSLSSCVEAKKVTQKTSYFTASSQPASGTKDIHKQTSHALVKSPLTSVLSNIKLVSTKSPEREATDADARERARRSLIFDEVESTSNGSCKEDTLEPGNKSKFSLSLKEKEAKKEFAENVSMLKQLLMKRNLAEDKVFENTWCLQPKPAEKLQSSQPESEKVLMNGNKRTLTLDEENTPCNEEDKEVEDLCRAKGVPIPSSSEKVKFRRSLDSAATLVFHNKTGLPLTSSPAPLRKGTCFDFDSSLNSVAAIRSAFRTCDDVDEECDSLCKDSLFGPRPSQSVISASAPATVTCSNLLGSFEECVLNGRLEPVSTVQGFSAEIAASGVFCPKHIIKPVTVFFYTLCDNDQISSPYMGHINLGKKGYHIPSKGTVQVTLFNPHGTVVKMFVVVYDLADMPPNSKTFLRQRTLNMPVGASDNHPDAHQWLRYLIHLRFASSKSGKIYLHTDIRMLIFRKSDADAATLHKTNVPYELRSFTHGPTNPKFSPRK